MLRKKADRPVYVSLSLSVLRDEEGSTVGYVSYAHDITERKRAEALLIEQKNILRFQAHHDALTRLPNRMLFFRPP